MIIAYFKDKDLEYIKKLTKQQRSNIEIGWRKLMAVGTLYGIKWDPANNQDLWYDLLEKIYGVEIKRFSKEIIQEYFKGKNFEELKKLTQWQRKAIDIGWRKLYAVAGLYGITWNPIGDEEIWYDLLEKIYGKKIERLNKEIVEEYFKDKNFEEMKKLISIQRWSIKIWWKGLCAISTLYGITWNPIADQDLWYDLLEQIHGEKKKFPPGLKIL